MQSIPSRFPRWFKVRYLCNYCQQQIFQEEWLQFLVCPLTKKPLRFDAMKQELVCDELQTSYPLKDGVPLLTCWDGKKLTDQQPQSSANQG
eukprot:jgi/Galph1/521/GphlegSOOS_G5295.1